MPGPTALCRLASPHALAILALALLVALAGCARTAPPGPGGAEPALVLDGATTGRLVTDDNLALPLRRWSPAGQPRAAILALHGFNDYAGAFADAGEAWAALGIAVYAYDQRGFGGAPHRGLWPGVAALTGDLRTAAALVRRRNPDIPLYLLGESMGGAVILAAAGERAGLQADGLILSAPAVWSRGTQPWYQRTALWVARTFLPWARPSGQGLEIRPSDNLPMLIALGRDPLVIKRTRVDAVAGLVDLMDAAMVGAQSVDLPVLMLYGANDELVPKRPTLRAWRALDDDPLATLAYYPAGWHLLFRDLQAAVPIADVAAWTLARDAGLASDAAREAGTRLAADAGETAGDAAE